MTIRFSDITGGGIPYGDTAGRPASPTTGKLYSNGETARLELYTDNGSWENIVQEVPGVSSISGNYSQATDSGVITIYGTNFVSGAVAIAIGSNGEQITADSTTFNSLVQLSATFTGLSNQYEPYDVKVMNPSNLFGILPDALYINASPVWVTSSGSLGTFTEQVSTTLSALSTTDSDSNTITYAVASGSSLPGTLSLDSSTGVISGRLPDIELETTYSFTINASDGVNTIPRSFSITSVILPTGGTITISGSYRIHTFTSNGTFTVPSVARSVEYLIVAGGGAGGSAFGGGGGAGGLLYSSSYTASPGDHAVVVGAGGAATAGNATGNKGANSSLNSIVALGGGGGGCQGESNPGTKLNGGSGGAPSHNTTYFGIGTSGQGFDSGNNLSPWTSPYSEPGGGGAGEKGGTPPNVNTSARGGNGLQYSISGTATYYAGGGGGGGGGPSYNANTSSAIGGLGGGGAGGASAPSNGTAGTSNTGGGGGGSHHYQESGYYGGAGGSGIVIVRYVV